MTPKFEHEGLYITSKGYFYSKWDSEQQLFVGKDLSLADIETHLNSAVYLENNLRLHHIFTPILTSSVFSVVFLRDFWAGFIKEITLNPWKDYPGDVLSLEEIDGDDIQYLEIYDYWEYVEHPDGEKEIYNLPSRFNFHGVSFPLISEELAQEYHSRVGEQIHYALSATSITEYMNTPIRIGKLGMTKTIYKDSVHEKIFEEATIPISLNTLIHSILWDMSFYGLGEERDNFFISSREAVEAIKNS